ncbi:ATP-dependent DNA ligase [Micromonospora sp. L32]
MLSAPVDAVPQGPRLAYEPKWDGFRALAFVEAAGVYLQSRAGKNLTPYFPDITRPIRHTFPPQVILDGELIVWERGRISVARLQRRITAGRGLLIMAREHRRTTSCGICSPTPAATSRSTRRCSTDRPGWRSCSRMRPRS